MNDLSTADLLAIQPHCIFCGGATAATSGEHCPPRALFEGRLAPEGFVFSACDDCNTGSSDADLVAAFMGHIDPTVDGASGQAVGLMRAVARQVPGVRGAGSYTATEARQAARRLGIRPALGQLFQELPFIRVTPEMSMAVETLAGKLTKAMYFQQTGRVFAAQGSILLHWFTNETLYRNGKVPALEVLETLPAVEPVLTRNGRDLTDQVRLAVSIPHGERQIVVRATFRKSFGFVTYGLCDPADMTRVVEAMRVVRGGGHLPMKLL